MVWTTGWWDKGIGLAHSKDLVTWSKQEWIPVMAHEPDARNCWAPEILYDPGSRRFLIYWSTTIPGRFKETEVTDGDRMQGGGVCNHRIYCTATGDFETYEKTRLLYDPGFNCIDATIVPARGRWLMFIKDETKAPVARKHIRMAWAEKPEGPWGPSGPAISPDWVEGPTALRVGEAWLLYYDAYTRGRFEGLTSKDLESWESIDARISFPRGARHGTAFAVPSEVPENLRKQ
jgi:beta-xylosidase